MENLLTPVILTIGFILAGTHTTNAQCEFNHTIIHCTLGHWDSSGMGDMLIHRDTHTFLHQLLIHSNQMNNGLIIESNYYVCAAGSHSQIIRPYT